VDAKVLEAWLDVDLFAIRPRKWNVEETLHRENGCAEEFTAESKLWLLLLNV